MTRALAFALAALLTGCAATGEPEASAVDSTSTAGDVTIPTNLVISSPRICAALAVYQMAKHDDWGLRATIAHATLNAFEAGGVPNCTTGVAVALTSDFSPRRWQDALDAVDAVTSGSYSISPDACLRATAVVPLSSVVNAKSPPAVWGQCVMHDLAFVEVQL
ncbi:hypothetical protein ARC78_15590 [Stenotrophomonas pictorum JCM 9942]|uniref:Lipoprotein n=1 Tax=Stenotrophomonas pictorum JCM 9942 TaxID=1236960 RepID=A0A0R0A006_9GAMM|nr:hypothetical protein [Stenotrophomonas pictorum]KRG38555.1 hypothetical protein ARC78_15590 [Stenotrophomonas pictorum JCM 9942]